MNWNILIIILFFVSCETKDRTRLAYAERKLPEFNATMINKPESVIPIENNEHIQSQVVNTEASLKEVDLQKNSIGYAIYDSPRQNILARKFMNTDEPKKSLLLVDNARNSKSGNFTSMSDDVMQIAQVTDPIRKSIQEDLNNFALKQGRAVSQKVVEIAWLKDANEARRVALNSERKMQMPFKVRNSDGKFVVYTDLEYKQAYRLAHKALKLGYYDVVVR